MSQIEINLILIDCLRSWCQSVPPYHRHLWTKMKLFCRPSEPLWNTSYYFRCWICSDCWCWGRCPSLYRLQQTCQTGRRGHVITKFYRGSKVYLSILSDSSSAGSWRGTGNKLKIGLFPIYEIKNLQMEKAASNSIYWCFTSYKQSLVAIGLKKIDCQLADPC